ncbi:MAG: DUF1579 family protein [Planctomycetes bacterium]|nr:DUF1579 family protein [Planctomycetota bacterium]
METAPPSAPQARLGLLAGVFSGEEILHPAPALPQGGRATGRFRSRMFEGSFLITDYEQECDGRVVFRGHGVYGFDAAERCYTMHWFDSLGGDPGGPVKGRWAGNHLVFQRECALGQQRYAYTIEGGDAFRFVMSFSPDGANWRPLLEGRYLRS